MRLLAVVLLVCLLVTGTVSAITVLPGAASTMKGITPVTVVQTTTPTPGPATGITDTRGALLVYSVPTGAAITIDGSGTGEVTSKYYPLPAGSHTVVLSLAGYQDYTETFTITPHETWSIHANLKQKLAASALQGVVATQAQKNPAPALQGAVVSEADWITVNLDSVPSNATVTDLYNDTYIGMTPLHLHVSPAMHYVKLTHPLYNWAGVRFNQSGDIVVTLVRTDTGPVTGQKAESSGTLTWNSGVAPADPALKAGNYASIVTLPATPLDIVPCPKDWTCLTPAEAKQQFGWYARYNNTPCGLEDNPNSPWHLATMKYCCRATSLGSLPQGALDAADIRDGDDIYIINDTWIGHGIVNKSPELQKTGEAGANPFQSFLDFLSGIISGSSQPTSRLAMVAFNPQPEPPGAPDVGRFK